MFRKLGISLAVLLIVGSILPTAIPAYAQTPEEWFAEAAKPYAGMTIKGISESTPPSKYMQEFLAPGFEKATGIKVEFEVTSWDEMYDKQIKDMEAGTGIYDFGYIEQDFIFAALEKNYLTDLTKLAEDNPQLVYPDFDLGDFTSFIDNFKDANGHLFGVPFEAFLKSYMYRKDLFEDPEIKAAFQAKYGWELRPAVNFKEYEQISEFFTEYGKEKGLELWGTTVTAAAHPASAYEMIETIWPSWGIYNWGINLENLKATSANGGTLDSDRAKEALAFWVNMLNYAPPEARSSTWDEVAASMGAGRVAQGWIYLENAGWIATDATKSKVVGKVAVALPPLYPGVINEAALGKGYIGYYDGGALGISWASKKKEAAWLWLQWMARKDLQGEFAKAGGRVVRNSTFTDPFVVQLDPQVGHYFTMLRIAGPLFKGAPPFPFHRQIFEIYLTYVQKAITGEMTAAQACDELAKAVDAELVKLGYAK